MKVTRQIELSKAEIKEAVIRYAKERRPGGLYSHDIGLDQYVELQWNHTDKSLKAIIDLDRIREPEPELEDEAPEVDLRTAADLKPQALTEA